MQIGPLLEKAGLDTETLHTLVGSIDLDAVSVERAPRWLQTLWRGPVAAMTLGRWIFLADFDLPVDRLRALLVHELVHVRQWQHAGPLTFLRRYLGDYLFGRLRRQGHVEAYRRIRYEVEARRIAGG